MTLIPLPPEFAHRTVPSLLARRAHENPDAPAVSGREGNTFRTLTFAELDHRSTKLGQILLERGLAVTGHPVAWAVDNSEGLAAIVLYHAVLKTGAFNVPVNTRLTPVEVSNLLAHCRAEGVLDLSALQQLLAQSPQDPTAPLWIGEESDLASVLYTSGTTGLPKGVEHTHSSSIAAGAAWSDCFELTSADVLQSPFPVTSGAGLHFNALSCLWAGAHVVIDEADLPGTFARIERYASTIYVAVPSIYQFWLDHAALHEHDLSNLRILDYGGSSMAPDVIRRLRAVLHGVGLMQTYGFTEGGPGGTYLPPAYAELRPGSIGSRPAGRFTQFKVLDAAGVEVGPDQPGELFLRGPSGMRGYHRDPAATTLVKGDDGWIASGDVVRYDAEGFLYFVDRRRELIVRGGYNIAPVEIEAALLAYAGVREAAVFGIPHASLGEVPCAAIVPSNSSQADTLIDGLRSHLLIHLADFKRPREIHIVGELPKNAAGKVVKQHLREMYSAPPITTNSVREN
ncbi:long-chain fatty acid--CoA ligase [Rhodococcus sp. MS16]|uniref:class I adenylate-forming enzyme family protein n=1 Tax=Rhodococcus sp. MS16 TaxID=2579941 RepID=UPI0015627EAD|nr:AMP-binding protein [Rhodococcus sp. MS16]NRI68727.1 long-chain fatty acid--CoA ligase [Rhodococcus sp. MS16]